MQSWVKVARARFSEENFNDNSITVGYLFTIKYDYVIYRNRTAEENLSFFK